jgi:hypothetical protein
VCASWLASLGFLSETSIAIAHTAEPLGAIGTHLEAVKKQS